MKRNPVKNLWLFIYWNFWYIPLLVFLLGIKISLISLLVETMEESRTGSGSGPLGGGSNRVLTRNAILKMVQENLRENQEYLKAHVHEHEQGQMTDNKKKIHAQIIKKDNLNTSNTGLGMGWAAQLRQSHQPLTSKDWEILAHLEKSHIEPTSLNRTDPKSIWLVLNDVPSGGGEIIAQLLEDLEEDNEFKHLEHEYRTPWPRFLLEEEQKSLVTWFEYQHLPRSYNRHFYFVNFTKYQQYVFENPIYINMVSDPVTRIRSVFKAKRADRQKAYDEVERREKIEAGSGQEWLKKDFTDCVIQGKDPECSYENGSLDFTLTVPFFCGQVNACVILNNKWALQSAKFNIEKYYSVVGVLEKLKESLSVLENYIPRFFSSTTIKTNHDNLSDMKRDIIGDDARDADDDNIANAKDGDETEKDKRVRRTLERKLPSEFELYDFIKARLNKQIKAISAMNTNSKSNVNNMKHLDFGHEKKFKNKLN